jgi:hypothetical protein
VTGSGRKRMTDDDMFKACEMHGARRVYDVAYARTQHRVHAIGVFAAGLSAAQRLPRANPYGGAG